MEIDFTGIPKLDGTVDFTGIPLAGEKPPDIAAEKRWVDDVISQGTEPSLFERVWRQFTEPSFEERAAKSQVSMQGAKETGMRPSEFEKDTGEYIKKGWENSVTGMLYTGEAAEGVPKEMLPYLSTKDKIAMQITGLVADLPLYVSGAVLGGGPASPITAAGGAFALPMGLRQVLMDRYEKGEVDSFQDWIGRFRDAIVETAKGESIGMMVGAAPGFFEEITTLWALGAALEGQVPDPKDFVETAALLGALKVGTGAPRLAKNKYAEKKLRKIYAREGKHPLEVVREQVELDKEYRTGAAKEKPTSQKEPEDLYQKGLQRQRQSEQSGEVSFKPSEISKPLQGFGQRIANFIQEEIKPLRFYPDLPMQFRNDVRLQIIGRLTVAKENVYDKVAVGIWGGLKNQQIKDSVELIYARDQVGRIKASKGHPDVTLKEAEALVKRLESKASPEVLQAAENYRIVSSQYTDWLIARGELEPGQLIEDYARHYTVDYTPEWAMRRGIPTRIRRPFKGYKKTARGSKKEYRQDQEAILGQFLELEYDKLIDDFILEQTKKWDIKPSLSKEQRQELFGVDKAGRAKTPKPRAIYEINGKEYMAWTPDMPFSRGFYPVTAVRETKAGPVEYKAYALGGHKNVSLIPKQIAKALMQFSEKGNKWAYRLNRLTSFWKTMAINANITSFNLWNLTGDSIIALMQHPGNLKRGDYQASITYIANQWKKGKQTPELREFEGFVKKHRTRVSGFTQSEMLQIGKSKNPLKEMFRLLQKTSESREAFQRLAYSHSLWRALKEGRGREMVEAHDWIDTAGLSTEEALGKIARDVLIDYNWNSKGYKTWIKGLVFPFGTFYFKGSKLHWDYIKKHPIKGITVLAAFPIIATAFNSRNDESRDIEANLPDYIRHKVHFNLGYLENGNPRVLVPQLPQDVLIGTKIFSVAADYANRVANKELTAKEAVPKMLKEWGLAEVKGTLYLAGPSIRFLQGLIKNKDPYDGTNIYRRDPGKMTWFDKRSDEGMFLAKCLAPFLTESIKAYEKGVPQDIALDQFLDKLVGLRAVGVYEVTPQDKVIIDGEEYEWDDVARMRNLEKRMLQQFGGIENKFVDSGLEPMEFIESGQADKYFVRAANQLADFAPEIKELSKEEKVNLAQNFIGGERIKNLFDPKTLNKWIDAKIERAKTDEEKKELAELKKEIRTKRLVEAIKGVPKAERTVVILNKLQDKGLPLKIQLETP